MRRDSAWTGNHHIQHHPSDWCYHGPANNFPWYHIGRGVFTDVNNRMKFYKSDWTDAFELSRGSVLKLLRGLLFCFVTIILPCLAFGNMNRDNTSNQLKMNDSLLGQGFAGAVFAVFSSQPLGLLLTTPPISLLINRP